MTGEQTAVDYQAMIDALTPALYRRLKTAVETGRWPDGRNVTPTQREHALQAVIAWEARNLAPEQRAGYIEPRACASQAGDRLSMQPITLLDLPAGSES